MSFPIFKDFDKSAQDVFDEDFGTSYTLKVKTAGPFNTTLTTNTTFDDRKISTKLATKWPHPSGFTLEKFELSADGKPTIETSLSGVAPGLKVEFKGDGEKKGNLSVTYKIPAVTFTTEVDLVNYSKISASALGGNGPISAGAAVDVVVDKTNVQSHNVTVGVGYALPKGFVGLRAKDNFSAVSGLFTYKVANNVTLAGSVAVPLKNTSGVSATLGSVFNCPVTGSLVKVKASSAGELSASAKKSLDTGFTVVGSVVVPRELKNFKFGVNATLG